MKKTWTGKFIIIFAYLLQLQYRKMSELELLDLVQEYCNIKQKH